MTFDNIFCIFPVTKESTHKEIYVWVSSSGSSRRNENERRGKEGSEISFNQFTNPNHALISSCMIWYDSSVVYIKHTHHEYEKNKSKEADDSREMKLVFQVLSLFPPLLLLLWIAKLAVAHIHSLFVLLYLVCIFFVVYICHCYSRLFFPQPHSKYSRF